MGPVMCIGGYNPRDAKFVGGGVGIYGLDAGGRTNEGPSTNTILSSAPGSALSEISPNWSS